MPLYAKGPQTIRQRLPLCSMRRVGACTQHTTSTHPQRQHNDTSNDTISSPEAALLLVSTRAQKRMGGETVKRQLGSCQSRSQSFVPLDQRSENESSGSNHYERTKEITEFWLSGSLRICIYGACLKWFGVYL